VIESGRTDRSKRRRRPEQVFRPPRFRLGGRYYAGMIRWQKVFLTPRAARLAFVAAGLAVAVLGVSLLPAEARGGHGFGGHHGLGGHGMHGPQLAGGRGHGSDAYTQAVSNERDKLLDSKLKSICRGC
jgi:hypothetical protein